MFVLKNRIITIPRIFTFSLDNSFRTVYYIHNPIAWMVVRHRKQKWKRNGQCIRRVLSRSFILSLSRAAFKHPPHRSAQGKSRFHGLLFSFAKQGTVPCSTHSIFSQYNSKNRSEFLVPNYVLPCESTFLPSGCTSMAHNTAYWYGKQCKEPRQLLFPGLLQQQEFCYFLLYV